MSASKNTPKDIQVMSSILKDVGVTDYEPKVLNQMLEFTYRFVTTILEDAQKISSHAKKKSIDKSDVNLALVIHMDRHFVLPPAREILLEYAEGKNSAVLPFIKSTAGPRLPPDRYSLTSCNYRLKCNKKKSTIPTPRVNMNIPYFPSTPSLGKMNPVVSMSNKGTPMTPLSSKPPTPVVTINRPGSKPVPTPIIKFHDGNSNLPTVSSSNMIPFLPSSSTINMPTSSSIKAETLTIAQSNGLKRKRDDEDDNTNYDA